MSAETARSPLGTTTLVQLQADRPVERKVVDARARIRAANAAAGRHVVVLDDDPTGSQVVQGIPVLTHWGDEDLRWAFAQPARAFFVLTNTRSLPAAEVRTLLEDLSDRLLRTADEVGATVELLSRSDSTLRGHFPLETEILSEVARRRGSPYDAVVLIPAYPDAGRVTVDDVHYAREGDQYLPVGTTGYARDAAFGYQHSALPDWVREKYLGRAVVVQSISLEDIRVGGVAHVAAQFMACLHRTVIVVNALSDSDLDVVALALVEAERTGWRALCRVGPSFVPARIGLERAKPLTSEDIDVPDHGDGRGLVVVGSHVDLTTRQIEQLQDLSDIVTVELDVRLLGDPGSAQEEIDRCAERVVDGLAHADVLLMTSRELVTTHVGEGSLALSRTTSAALVELTRRAVVHRRPAWVIAKGGITSHDVATHGLRIRRATVLGQLFEGIVSVWRIEPDGHPGGLAGLPFVVFAGNVGDPTSLRTAVLTLRTAAERGGGVRP